MSQFITPGIDAAPPRNLTRELTKIHKAQLKFAPEDYALEAKYGPLYNRLDLGKASENLLGYTDDSGQYHPGTLGLGRTIAATNRTGDVADVERLGGRASQALLNANPYLRGALDRLNARMNNSPLLSQLNTQASDALAAHGQLSQQDIESLSQQTLSGFADRGMATGNQSLGAELLSRDAAVRGRQLAAQQFAGQVQGLNQGQNQFVAQGTALDASTLSDPFMAILGRPSNLGATAALPGSGQIYNPANYTQYAQDLFSTNQAQALNLGIANANNQAATRQAIANIGSSFSDERIKRNIREVGRDEEGTPVKEWTYKTDPHRRRWRGYMAQDLEKTRPEAVVTDPVSGLKAVNYSELPVKLSLAGRLGFKEAA